MPTNRQNGEMNRTASLISILLLTLVASNSTMLHLRSVPRPPPEPTPLWLYLRDGQDLAPSEKLVVLIAVGDLMLGRDMASRSQVFSQVATELRSADLALGNFEGAIPVAGLAPADLSGDPAYEPYRLLIPTNAIEELREAGFDLLSLVNNHALDAGEAGFTNTQAVLESAGIMALGAGFGPEGTSQFVIRQIKGITIAFLAFNRISLPHISTGNQSLDHRESQAPPVNTQTQHTVETIKTVIRLVRMEADFVVVSIHWGKEYQLQHDSGQKELAETMLKAGADLVLGHHPHVVQETELIELEGRENTQRAQFIAYSLGNFAFDQGWEETGQGLALRIYLDERGLRAVQALPIWTSPRPHWMRYDEAYALLKRVSPPPPQLGFTCQVNTCQPVTIPQASTPGLFWSGQIDLTGDGVPEKIHRREQCVTIYQDNQQVWQSPPEWQVVDLALGDPNDDGRAELMLALYKPEPSGRETSHPFIIGYRGGMYRILWGGSSVRDPILELELGDVTGDGVQELVVLEEGRTDNQRFVSVWRWHGWGFSKLWRSQSGFYQDLTIIPGKIGGLQTISVYAPRYGVQIGLDPDKSD